MGSVKLFNLKRIKENKEIARGFIHKTFYHTHQIDVNETLKRDVTNSIAQPKHYRECYIYQEKRIFSYHYGYIYNTLSDKTLSDKSDEFFSR